ncbi:uncharacterized protein [Centruroides vittatus]|uniref:uncharacterized protein n=1 Tax=Centruroides vittatus TaxID=120091 RepID=UPI00350F59E1
MMEYCGLDPFPSTSTTSAPPNEADSGYEPSPSSTSGPNSMFNFEEEDSCSEPDDMFNLHSPSEDDSDEDFRSRITGHSTSSPIPIPFPGRQMLLSNSTPRLGYSITHSPFRRLSCPQILNTGLVRVMRHVSTQTCPDRDRDTVDDEPRLAPVRAPLPDVVQHNGSRSGHVERARSASVSLPVGSLDTSNIVEVGRRLRRLSNDFERSMRSASGLSLLFQTRSRRSRSYSQSDT